MNVVNLPNEVFLIILGYLSYDEVAKTRAVSRRFNEVCQLALNFGFHKAVHRHSTSFKIIKMLLPRRESERRHHFLARHADILTSVETRISMLSMTYTKYMDMNLCCFIPGRVLDEIFRILNVISDTVTKKPLRPHEVLQELRDISSMAIEHFDEQIATRLKLKVGEPLNISASSSKNLTNTSPGMCLLRHSIASEPVTPRNNVSIKRWNQSFETSNRSILSPTASIGEANMSSTNKKGCDCDVNSSAVIERINKREEICSKAMTKLSRRLKHAMHNVSEMNTQMLDFKKRLEDIEARNCELLTTLQQITCGEITVATVREIIAKNTVLSKASTSAASVLTTSKSVPETTRISALKRRFSVDLGGLESSVSNGLQPSVGKKRRTETTTKKLPPLRPIRAFNTSDSDSD